MGASKTDHYQAEHNSLATLAKALGHPARVAILDFLLGVDRCICEDIVKVLPLAQPTVSQHLRELKAAGFIQGNVEGNAVCYCVAPAALELLHEQLTGLVHRATQQHNRCC
ncbi:MAG: winged helix-turn-helix transcriptional regulator [Lewinella sp.]|nr:winged helix-turn-helix transcriptional regulator [Lewinella sp.]